MKEIDVNGLFKALQDNGEAKLSDHEKKKPENTKLMKKYFVDEVYDIGSDLYKSTYRIPAGKDFDKCIDDMINYFFQHSSNIKAVKEDCKKDLASKKLSAKTGAEITISMNTFECKAYQKEMSR